MTNASTPEKVKLINVRNTEPELASLLTENEELKASNKELMDALKAAEGWKIRPEISALGEI